MAKSRAIKTVGISSKTTKVDASSIVEDEFGNYRIRAGQLKGVFVARAFPKAESEGQGLIAEATGASEADAIAALKVALTERETERTAARRWDPKADVSVPSKEEFIEALLQTKLSKPQISMLKAHTVAGKDGMSVDELMNVAGYKSEATAMKVLGRAGTLFADFLGVDLQSNNNTGPFNSVRILGCREDDEAATPRIWILHEELRNAVRVAL